MTEHITDHHLIFTLTIVSYSCDLLWELKINKSFLCRRLFNPAFLNNGGEAQPIPLNTALAAVIYFGSYQLIFINKHLTQIEVAIQLEESKPKCSFKLYYKYISNQFCVNVFNATEMAL